MILLMHIHERSHIVNKLTFVSSINAWLLRAATECARHTASLSVHLFLDSLRVCLTNKPRYQSVAVGRICAVQRSCDVVSRSRGADLPGCVTRQTRQTCLLQQVQSQAALGSQGTVLCCVVHDTVICFFLTPRL